MPVDDGVDTHQRRPSQIGRVEVGEVSGVGISAAGAHEDGLNGRAVGEVGVESGAHGHGIAG